MDFELILAVDEKWGIGKSDGIPWSVPEDLQFFKEKTDGNIIIMAQLKSIGDKILILKN
jgi:dihydrofolate reductase